MNDFNIIIPLEKGVNGDTLSGIASATSVDRDDEKMSQEALEMMARDIKTEGVNLFGNHTHEWENILGGIDNADVLDNKLRININLNKANPKYPQLVGTLGTKGVRVGLSVGGGVKDFSWEYDKTLGKKIKVMKAVKVWEVSVVGIPSNAESYLGLSHAIAKSARMPELKKCANCWTETEGHTCPMCLTPLNL